MTEQILKIPDKYKRLGGQVTFDPSPADKLRIILEGLPGSGKSTLMGARPRTAIIDCDKAQQNVIVHGNGTVYFPVDSFDDYLKIKAELLKDAKSGNRVFDCVALDTLDAFIDLLDRHLIQDRNKTGELDSMKQWGHKGAGYRVIGDRLKRELDELDRAGYAFMLNCHMLEKEIEFGETTQVVRRCVMPQTFMKDLVGMVDAKFRVVRSMDEEPVYVEKTKEIGGKTKTIKVKTGRKTVLRYWAFMLPPSAAEKFDDTKRRVPTLVEPIELPLENPWAAFDKSYQEACEQAKTLMPDGPVTTP